MFLKRLFLDAGKIIATVWMWPIYDIICASSLLGGMTPLLQLGLVKVPRIQQVNDRLLKRLIIALLWIPMITMNVICTTQGYYPRSYYDLRNFEPQFRMFTYARLMVFGLGPFLGHPSSPPSAHV